MFIYLYKYKIEEGFFGRVVETLVVNKVRATSFWKNGSEIDLIHNDISIEVKYQEKINPEDYKPVLDFMKKFGKREGLIITKNDARELKFEEGIIKFIPAWKWLLENGI